MSKRFAPVLPPSSEVTQFHPKTLVANVPEKAQVFIQSIEDVISEIFVD